MKKGMGRSSKLLPNSFRIISSCIKTISTNASTAVRSASASVAASISNGDDRKEQVLWAGFDKLELSSTAFRHVLLLGYRNGFQIFDVEDACGLSELVSRREGPVTFLQMLPAPGSSGDVRKYKSAHPIVVLVAGDHDEEKITSYRYARFEHARYSSEESSFQSIFDPPSSVRFYSMKSNEYVKVIGFKSAVLMVRCSSRVVAVGLEEQIYCFDVLTLEKKFIVVTYPVPQLGEPGVYGINTGYGPMAVGTRWLAYPPSRPFLLTTDRVSPKSVSAGVSPSTSPGSGTIMARYAVESSKHLASGLLSLGDMGYKKLSKYCPELLPDSSGSPGWKIGKLAASEPENAGVVAIRDLFCSEVISQFRAHTSPISALCFDPSGTLLVTASVHGNSMNIFRIMPYHKCGGASSSDWSTSYLHLYKLYRGITSAVIQDICFSQYSQWIAIVSSRGTCHIFVISPFGGDDCFQTLHALGQGSSLLLVPSSPWWSTSSFTINHQHSLPPPTCTLAAVTRIKCNDSGLLNSVSNAAASMAGKLWVPSGAVAAVFHNSNAMDSVENKPNRPLEHILVYTPSGFVVQHEIKFPIVSGSGSECLADPQVSMQNEELRVRVEPLQWWDVSKGLDNTEREDSFSGGVFDGSYEPEVNDDSKNSFQDNVGDGEKKETKSNSLKPPEKSHFYLSNSEVQVKSCRLPIRQRTMIHFHVLESPQSDCGLGGEFEIEMASSYEVEIRHRDLLPVFENSRGVPTGLKDGCISSSEKHPIVSTKCCQTRQKTKEASAIYQSKSSSHSSTESSGGGSTGGIDELLDLDHMSIDRSSMNFNHSMGDWNTKSGEINGLEVPSKDHRSRDYMKLCEEDHDVNGTITRSSSLGNDNQLPNANNADTDPSGLISSRNLEQLDLGQVRKEGYCNKMKLNDHYKCNETASDKIGTDGNAHQEDNHDDEGWTGGVFEFFEEG